jgi:hypothetical protein
MKKNVPYLRVINVIILLCFFVTISCATVKQGEPEEPELSHNEMLQGLGIVTNMDDLTDPDGNSLPDGYNPLGKKCGVFSPLKEIYFAGYYYYAGRSQYLIDDSKAGLGGLYTSGTDDSWVESHYKNCIGADVDGDGFEEVVVVYYASGTLYLKVIDNDNGTYGEYNKPVITGITGNLPVFPQYQPALAKGDLDGDGKDELIMGFSYWAWILEDKDSDYAVTSRNYSNSRDLYIAAGDIDGDSQDEFIITYYYGNNAYCDIFDGDFSTPFITRYNYHLHAADLYSFTFEQRVHVCMGDIDGDRLDEIVFHGESSVGNEHWSLLAMDDAKHDFAWLDFFTYTWQDNNALYIFGGYTHSPALAILDYNGDGLDDIFASTAIYDYKVGSSTGHPASPNNNNIEMIQWIFSDAVTNLWTGDVDGDADDPYRKDEIVYFYGGRFWIGGQDAQGNHQHQTVLNIGHNSYSTLCLANVDDDTPIIEYTGDHELLFTDPTVIAVLACPPYHSGCGQNSGSCGTTFGKSTTQGVEETESTGFSVGFSIGYEYEDPFGVSKASFKMTVEESMDWISSQSSEIEKYIAYSSGPDEDKVIFTAIPFDVYYYTILSSPDPSEIGKPMTINIPREMQTLSVSRNFFNSKNGDKLDIEGTVLPHTIGDVWSYPSLAERNSLLATEGIYSPDSPVGVGSGSITVGIRKTQGQGTGTYSDFSVKVESEVGSGGFTVGASAGFHYGHEYTITNTESTMYEGTVGDIPDVYYTWDKAYIFGLFTYPFEYEGQTFTVVNYWVE